MVNEKLIAFILKARQNKRSDDQISQQLLSVGWKQDAVSEAFAEIKSKNLAAPPQAKPAQQKQPASQPLVKTPAQPAQQPAKQQPAVQQPPLQVPAQPVLQAAAQPQQQPTVQTPIQQPAATSPVQPPQVTPPQQQPIAPPTIQPPPQSAGFPQAQAQPSQQPIPPAKQIDLQQPRKKSFLSSLFGKKPAQMPTQPATTAQQPSSQPQPPAQTAPIAPAPAQQQPAPAPSGPPASILQQLPDRAQPPQAAAQQPVAQPQQPAKPSGGIMKFLPIIAIVVLLAAVGAAYYFFVLAPTSALEQQMQPPPAGEQQNATPQNQTQMAAGPLECGTDLGCLAEASKECKPSKATTSTTEEFMGVLVTSTSYLEIKGEEAGKCMLYVKAEDESVKLGDSLVVAALAKGTSMEEIRNQEAEATGRARQAVGMGGTCAFSAAALTSMINRWKAGAYSTSDYAGADCSGAIFEDALLSPSATASLLINKTSGTQTKTKPNATQAPSATGTPAANATNQTKANSANATKTAGSNTTTAPKANVTNATASVTNATKANATNATNATYFSYSRRFNSYFPERLDWFCTDRDMEFYRMHWQEYFGGGCSVGKPKEGYVTYDEYIATNCTLLPCCINGPYNEYSRSYDYFECGYEEYVNNEASG